jgi:hypothetical protein
MLHTCYPHVVLVRHAQSEWSREGRFTGWADPRHPARDPRYEDVPRRLLPGGESLAQTRARVTAFWREAGGRDVDGLVCGHIHRAAIDDSHGVLYLNSGDWVESCSALVEDAEGGLPILQWPNAGALERLVAEGGIPQRPEPPKKRAFWPRPNRAGHPQGPGRRTGGRVSRYR